MKRKCENCEWWNEHPNYDAVANGECRKKSPITTFCTDPQCLPQMEWPWTKPYDWCGEFKEKENEVEK